MSKNGHWKKFGIPICPKMEVYGKKKFKKFTIVRI
jgi:hypothetical protein